MSNAQLESGDSNELEALFDSIVQANNSGSPAAPASEPAPAVEVEATAPAAASGEPQGDWQMMEGLSEPASTMFSKIGQLTRTLHDTLRDLGYDKSLEEAASAIPDARERLNYISTLTEQAAERALNAVDAAMPLQDKLQASSAALAERWQKLYDKQLSVEEFKQLAAETREYFTTVQTTSKDTSSQLLEIMMAQDFQDLTGQVIKKIVSLAQNLENGLMNALIEVVPEARRTQEVDSLMNGPVINAEGRSDVVVNQQQVDDLLDSLGF